MGLSSAIRRRHSLQSAYTGLSRVNYTKLAEFDYLFVMGVRDYAALGETPPADTFMVRLQRDWLVPIGCGSTALILIGGLGTFTTGNAKRSQMFMRARVAAQGLTVAAMMWSLHYKLTAAAPKTQKDSHNF